MSEAVSYGTIFSGGRIMLENYINQIITMGALADSVTIIDDRQIIEMTSASSCSCPNNIITDISSSGTLKTLMDQYEADLLSERVAACKNHSRLARELGVTRQTLLNKLSKYGLL